MTRFTLTFYNETLAGGRTEANKLADANFYATNGLHWHGQKASFTNGVLTIDSKTQAVVAQGVMSEPLKVDFSGTPVSITGDPDAGTLTWTTFGGTTGNFNIAGTPFYKKAAVKTAKTEAVGGVSCHVLVTHLDESTATYDTNKLSISGDTVILTNSEGETVATISLTDYYNTAYAKGASDLWDGITVTCSVSASASASASASTYYSSSYGGYRATGTASASASASGTATVSATVNGVAKTKTDTDTDSDSDSDTGYGGPTITASTFA